MSRRIGVRIDARITEQERVWLDVHADRFGVSRSEAIREAIRRLRMTTDDAVMADLAGLRSEVEDLKGRMGRLESRNRFLEKKVYALQKFSVAREAYAAVREREAKLAVLQKALAEISVDD